MFKDEALRLLIVESNPAMGDAVESELRRAGLAFTTRRVTTREAFLDPAAEFAPHSNGAHSIICSRMS
jgi:hypothetical protein